MMKLRSSKAFTLIELLIVVVIIGILAGIVLAVLNPAQQQRRAREAVFQSNVGKMCAGLMACASATTNAQLCDTKAEIGLQDPTGQPIGGSTYAINSSATYSATDQTVSSSTAQVFINARYDSAVATGCRATCSYDFSPTATNPSVPPSFLGCIVGS